MIIQVIQLTAKEVTCARFKRTGKEPLPVSGLRLPWNTLEELGAIFKENCPSSSEETRTILAVPLSMITLREITLPFSDRRKIRAILPMEIAGETAVENSSPICDAFPLANGNMMAGWLSRETIDPLIELLKEAGHEPEIVTVACFNWHYLLPPGDEQITAINDDSAVMVSKEGKPAYFRHLSSNSAMLEQTLAAVELTHDLHVENRYYLEHTGNQTGSFSRPLPVPQLLLQGLANGDLPPEALASPLAVALSFCAGDTMFNLRTGPLAWKGRRSRVLRSFRIPIALAVILVLLLFAELSVRWYLLSSDMASLNSSIAKIYKEVFPTRNKAVDESAELKAEIKRLQGTGSSLQVLAFLNVLAENKGDGINAVSEIELDSTRFLLKGDARSSADINAFRQRLADKDWTVDQPELTTRPDGTVLFTLKGSRKGSK